LWPETVEALRAAIAERPKAKDAADDGLAFVTKYGARWSKSDTMTVEKSDLGYKVKGNTSNPVSQEFGKLLKSLGIKTNGNKRDGLNFYALRHTFATIAGESRDQVSVNAIMGHSPASNDMASVYRERIGDDRLRAVVEHVRSWLLGSTHAEKQSA
jgi:integrase